MPTELPRNPTVPSSPRFTKPAPEPPATKSSPHGAPDLVLSDRLGDSGMMGGRKLLLWYQASSVLRAGCCKSYRR